MTVRSGGSRLGLRLLGVGDGAALAGVAAVAPRAHGNRVTYAHPGVEEWFANGPLGVEQGFTLARAPAQRGAGPLTFSLALSGNLRAALSDGGKALLLSRGRQEVLGYRGLASSDARGRALRSWLQLRGSQLLIRVDARGAVYPVRVDPLIMKAALTASDGANGDGLAASVSVSGDGSTVVAGAPGATVSGNSQQGAAYVFTEPGGGWATGTETAKLTASDGAASDNLGTSVAISSDGSTIVAGAPGATVNSNSKQGAAYVFAEPGGGWATGTETAKLTASDGVAGDGVGFAVAISADGSTVVAGQCGCNGAGAAYVFVRSGSTWASATQNAKLTASAGQNGDELGSALGISADGSTIVAGACQCITFPAVGAAYVFTEPGGGWSDENETAKLTASDGAADDVFGYSVAISGDGSTVAAGAPGATVNGNPSQGAAYVYLRGAGWSTGTETAKLTASDGAANDGLGNGVALNGNGSTLIAGAPGAQVGSSPVQGAAYQFDLPGLGWATGTQTAKLTDANGLPGDEFGFSVAMSTDSSTMVAGVFFGNGGAGQADLFGVTPQFESQTTSAVGSDPAGVATGDFNGDGIPDMVTANCCDNTVSVLIGNGDGSFQTQQTHAVGVAPTAVAVGDFNGDGKLDLAVVDQGDNTVSILLGNGDGTFQSAVPYPVGDLPDAITVGDFNGDGIPDVAVANIGPSPTQSTVSVLLGKGDGTFEAATDYAVGGEPEGIAVADLNADGKQDLVTSNCCDNDVSVLLGNGDGTFQTPAPTYAAGNSPYAVAIGDFNGDGKPDLAVTNDDSTGGSTGSVAVLLGNGDGTFQPLTDYGVGGTPQSVSVSDFNGDGYQDIVTSNASDGTVSVLLGNGDGTFQSQQTEAVGSGPSSVAVSDLNRDGKPDIAVANRGDDTAGVLLNSTSPFTSAAIPASGSTVGAGSVLIDELRLAGPSGSFADQLADLYNTGSSAVSVGGWQFQTSGGGFTTIPLGTTIPPDGHLLLTAPANYYSLSSYATSNGELPSGPLLALPTEGVRLVAPGGSVIDKVGFNAAPTGFYAGTKLSIPATFPTGQFAWVRNFSNGAPVNTNDNASDFSYVSTSDNDSAHGSPLLGAPGPGNLVSPIVHNDVLQSSLLDPSAAQDASPNRIYTAGSPGTLIVNRVFTNCSGQTPTPGTPCANVPAGTTPKTVTRLRFRITGLTTVNSPGAGSTQAVLKADTSTGEAGLAPAACSGTTDVLGLPLDSPSVSGSGGLNSTWTATAELPPGGLAPGECLNVEFEFDVTQPGHFGFAYNAEDDLVAAPPASAGLGGSSSGGGGSTQGGPPSSPGGSPAAPGGSPAGTAGSPPPKACAGAARVPLSLLGPPIPDLVTGILGRSSSSARPRAITTGGCGTPAVKPRPKGSVAAHPGRVRAGHRVRVAGTIGPRCVAGAKVRVISRAFAPGRAVRVALVHASRAGLFSIWLRVPRSRKAGTYLVNATCGGRQFASAKLKVTR